MTIMRPNSGNPNVFQLSDITGHSKMEVKDADGFVVWSVDSKGNMRLRGSVMRV